ncbi:GFA family protein [Hoeflea sp.]|uniref:GFA family protein n=1 Tax=Hoeflea sp. TaxID=1940281 RepID=UPI002AFF2D1B|nr:GFA family protein [Hoeflea sp.]
MATELSGGCGCGALRYRLKSKPMIVHCCHCKDCQRQTGSAFVVNAVIERDNIEIDQGNSVAFTMPTDSGTPHDLYRCEDCGTTVWSDYGRRKTMVFLRAGTLDDPGSLPPDVHIFIRSKLPWVSLPADIPAFDVFYSSVEAFWPEEALMRRKALGF